MDPAIPGTVAWVDKAAARGGGKSMEDARTIELLVELHQGLERLGPGDDASTRRALGLCTPRPADPVVLDVGCGTGAQALCLARSGMRVVAVDRVAGFVATLARRARAAGLAARVTPCLADMAQLPFGPGAFDIVWSEGAAYFLGFDEALARWRPLLRPGGWLVVTELAWFGPERPAEAACFWAEHYPAMRDDAANLAVAAQAGFRVAGHFRLPAAAWRAYHAPLQARLPAFRAAHAGEPAAMAVAEATQAEITLMAHHAACCGYSFYVLQRA